MFSVKFSVAIFYMSFRAGQLSYSPLQLCYPVLTKYHPPVNSKNCQRSFPGEDGQVPFKIAIVHILRYTIAAWKALWSLNKHAHVARAPRCCHGSGCFG